MYVRINGESRQVEESATLQQVLFNLGYQGSFVAVAVNKSCIKRSDLAVTQVKAGDDIEILAPMAGG